MSSPAVRACARTRASRRTVGRGLVTVRCSPPRRLPAPPTARRRRIRGVDARASRGPCRAPSAAATVGSRTAALEPQRPRALRSPTGRRLRMPGTGPGRPWHRQPSPSPTAAGAGRWRHDGAPVLLPPGEERVERFEEHREDVRLLLRGEVVSGLQARQSRRSDPGFPDEVAARPVVRRQPRGPAVQARVAVSPGRLVAARREGRHTGQGRVADASLPGRSADRVTGPPGLRAAGVLTPPGRPPWCRGPWRRRTSAVPRSPRRRRRCRPPRRGRPR